jgi:RNA polymerase sigma-70 factor (ECF subfamily)
MAAVSTFTQGRELLDAARAGDETAFARLVEEHRAELLAHCYRMLGSLHDAEDVLQETLLRAWRGLPDFGGRSSLRTWLYRIATNASLDAIKRRPKRVLPVDYGPMATATAHDPGPPLAETVWIEPYRDEALGTVEGYASPEARYEQREAVELAFIAALQLLPAMQRAVLILREVLGFSAREVSELLDTTVAAVNSALQRARKTVEERLPDRSQQETLRLLGDERLRELIDAYVEAWARADVDAVKALLAEDAVFSMPPWSMWWRGRDTIAGFAAEADEACVVSRSLPIRVNGQLAIAHYREDGDTGCHRPLAIDVFALEGVLIKEITAFVMPEIFSRLGLPAEL